MSNTEQAQEPTMEEILASIRRIISDDSETETPDEPEAAAEEPAAEAEEAPEMVEPPASAEPDEAEQIDFDALDIGDDDEEEDVLDLTDVVEDTAEEDAEVAGFEEDASDDLGDIEFVDIEETAEPEEAAEPEMAFDAVSEPEAEPSADERIMSEVTDGAVASAFGQLASTLLSRDGSTRTLEELVQEMLRPMLKSWLDENLPSIVEDLVRQEIERAARRGGGGR